MSSNTLPDNGFQAAPEAPESQGVEWVTISVAVPRDMQRRIAAESRRLNLRRSVLCRLWISDSLVRSEQAA